MQCQNKSLFFLKPIVAVLKSDWLSCARDRITIITFCINAPVKQSHYSSCCVHRIKVLMGLFCRNVTVLLVYCQ